MASINERIGSVIRRNRELRGLSQEGLAALAEMSRAHVGEIERGEVTPSFVTLQKIASALGEKLSDLIIQYENNSGIT